MLPDFMLRAQESLLPDANVAVVIDVRNRSFLTDYTGTFKQLEGEGYHFDILFLRPLMKYYSGVIQKHDVPIH